MAKVSTRCIFCDSSEKLTREHIFPNWLNEYIPKIFLKTKHTASMTAVGIDSTGTKQPIPLEHLVTVGGLQQAGDPHSRKLRVVCAICNNEWMSNLQKKAKQHLVPLIRDDWSQVATASRAIVAAWATMFTMVFEFSDLNTLMTTFGERNHLRLHRSPPPNWYIWIGRYDGILWKKAVNHFGFIGAIKVNDGVVSSFSAELPEGATCSGPRQSTGFLLGKLFVQTFSTRAPEPSVDVDEFAAQHGLCAVWPAKSSLTLPSRILGDYEADAISRCFMPAEFQPYMRHAWEMAPQ